jgi:hypothetical protein
MATLQGKAVKNTYRQVLQIGANNVGVSGTLQRVQDGAGVNTALSLSTIAATIHGDLTITGDLIITGGGIQIQDLIDDTVASLIQNGTGITWTYNDGARTLTGNFTGTTSVVAEGSNLYYTQARFDSAFAAKTTTNLTEGANLYFTTARGDANFATNFATKTTTNLPEGTNLYFTNARARTALSVTGGTGLSYDNTTGVFNLAAIPNASLTNSSITINGQSVSLGGTVTLTTTNIAEGTNLYWTEARGNSNFTTNLAASSTTNLAEGTNLYYTQARFDTAFSNKTTTNLTEGTNLYYTQARFNSALAAKSTTDLAEGTNLYYTDTRARLALSSSATGLSYANNSGVFSLTAGYAIPTTVKLGQYDTAYNRSIVSAAVSGTTTKTLSLTQQDANVVSATWTDLGITTINGTANQIAATTVANTTTLAFTNDVTMPNNLVVSGNLTINGTATYVNTQSISAKDPLFEVANDNNTTDAVDIGYYGRYYDTPQTRVEFTGLFRDASDAGKFKFFTGLVDEPTNVVNTTGTGYTVGTLVANFEGNLAGTANAANALSTARTIAASGDAVWSVSFDGSANVTSALTLANTGVTATTYGTSTAVPTIAIDGKGRITSASNTNITFPVTTVNGAAGTVVLTTTNIAEGTNQYFTTGRAQSAITLSTTGTSGAATYTSGNINVPIYIGGSGTINEIAAFDTTGTINSLSTATYPSLTELSYVKGVTSAIQTQLNSKLNLSGGTLSGGLTGTTGTFSGILTTPQVKAATSAGLSINANSGTQVADFGAGGSANITFFGGLSGTSATLSSTLGVTGALNGTSASFSSTATATAFIPSGATAPTNGMYLSAANTLDFSTNTTNRLSISSTGVATFSSGLEINSSVANIVALTMSANSTGGVRQRFLNQAASGVYNFQIGSNITTNNAFEIMPSTAADGTTFSTAVFKILNTGNVGIGTPSFYNAKLSIQKASSEAQPNEQIRMQSTGGAVPSTWRFDVNAASGTFSITDNAVGERFNIDSTGAVTFNKGNDPTINLKNTNASSIMRGTINWYGADSSNVGARIFVDGESTGINSNMYFYTKNASTLTERIRIISTGFTKHSNNGSYVSSTGPQHEFVSNVTDNETLYIMNTASSPYGTHTYFNFAPNNGTNFFEHWRDGSVTRGKFYSNGGLANYQANNTNLSDERTKKDIIPLESYWDKFKAIEIVKFKYIDQTHDDYNIGVIAQQVELIAPEFIDVDGWGETPKDEVPLKSVYTADLHHATIKVLQEAMAKIENLEAEMAILKAK